MRAFVLVHPAWHGGWCWKKVVPLLRRAGHEVFTPTLTGLGERRHLARPEVGLDVHVEDVANVLKYEGLTDVVLVGHSSSGAVITGVAERVPAQIGHLVYLDAFVPEHGESVIDLVAPERRRALEALVAAEGEGWRLPRFAPPPWEVIVREMWGVTEDDDVRWIAGLVESTPFRHFTEPVRRSNPVAAHVPRTYVRCRRFRSERFDRHADMARQTPGWRYRELDAGHHPATTVPEQVVRLLVEVAA